MKTCLFLVIQDEISLGSDFAEPHNSNNSTIAV